MKIKYKSIISIVLMILVVISILTPKSQAAGLVIAFSQSTAKVGDTITVTVTGQGISGRADLSISGNATLSQNSVFVDNGSASVSLTVKGTGSIRVTATAVDMADSATAAPYTGATGGTITVANTPAGNSSTENSSGGSSSSKPSTGSNVSENSNTPQKSNNANLSNLGIKPNDFTGFKPATTSYDVTVPEEIESIEVYATVAHAKAKIEGIGTKTLQKGTNVFNIVVTAEDGTTKTYTIHVTREGSEEEETEESVENGEVTKGLSNLTIENLSLKPSFTEDVYEYEVDYIGENTTLDIQAVTTHPDYTVEILGNEELKEGENTITILVSDKEGNNIATYQVTVNKSLVDKEALLKEEQQKQKEEQRKMFMITGGIVAIIAIIIIVIVIKRRRSRAYAEEFSGVPFGGINDEDNYYDDYNNQFDTNKNEITDTQVDNLSLEEEEENLSVMQESKRKIAIDNTEEMNEKERAKRAFLNGYNSDSDADYDDYEDDKPKRGRKKGKRFK